MKKVLVAYFSCSGTTKAAAVKLSEMLPADLYEIMPAQPYSEADLDWTNRQSRSSVEMRDPSSRPAIATRVERMDEYDIVYIGFPVWWYIAPTIINTFIESYDLKGKTLIPFATSGGSGIGGCEENLRSAYPDLLWKRGKLLNGTITASLVKQWSESQE